MSLESEPLIFPPVPQVPPEPNKWQQRAIETNGWDTRANRIDAAAAALAKVSVPHMDTWPGIVGAGIAYGVDPFDGRDARKQGVDSETLLQYGVKNKIGEKIDAGGDKIKFFYALYHIWRNNQAPKAALAPIALQNLANMAITGADSMFKQKHEEKIKPSIAGKRSTLLQTGGIGISVIGTKVAETHPTVGRAIRVSGATIGLAGLAIFGIKATKGYFKELYWGIHEPMTFETKPELNPNSTEPQRV